jgi:predicted nucleic acid-binding protein
MQAFLDSSVLVAAFYGDHQHHAKSIALFAGRKKSTGATAAHCLAEVYAVVTGMPGKNRASPDEAMLFLNDVRERLTVVALNETEHFAVLEDCASAGIAGGTLYDALIAQCAVKSRAQTIHTWNTKHFTRLGRRVAERLREP